MRTTYQMFALGILCAFLWVAPQQAKAQDNKKLAKDLLGKWKLDDFAVKIDEGKATDDEKKQFAMMQTMSNKMKEQMKGNLSFEFKKDYTFTLTSIKKDKTETKQGVWKLEGNKLTLTAGGEEKPEIMEASVIDKKMNLKSIKEGKNVYTLMTFIR